MTKVIDVEKDPKTGVYGVRSRRKKKKKKKRDRKLGEMRSARRKRKRSGSKKPKRSRGSKLRNLPTGSVLLMNPAPNFDTVRRVFKAKKELSEFTEELKDLKQNAPIGAIAWAVTALVTAATVWWGVKKVEEGTAPLGGLGRWLPPLFWSSPLFAGAYFAMKQGAEVRAPRAKIWTRAAAATLFGSGLVLFYKKLPSRQKGEVLAHCEGISRSEGGKRLNMVPAGEPDIPELQDSLVVPVWVENKTTGAITFRACGVVNVWPSAEKAVPAYSRPMATAIGDRGTPLRSLRDTWTLKGGERKEFLFRFPRVTDWGVGRYVEFEIVLYQGATDTVLDVLRGKASAV